MKVLLPLVIALSLAPAAWAASMTGHLHLSDGKTFPEGTQLSLYHEATKASGSVPVDAAGNFVVEGLAEGEMIRLGVPIDYEFTSVSAPFHIALERQEVGPLDSEVAGPAASEFTAEVIWKDHKVKWAEMRRRIVRKMSEGFFKVAKLTPEQQETFITLRVESEDRVLKDLHEHRTQYLAPSRLMDDFCASLQKSFGNDLAQQYREMQYDNSGWEVLQGRPELEANNWLSAEEQGKLAHAWGAILFEAADHAMDPDFQKSTATREAKLAYTDKITVAYLEAAKSQLSPAQFATLQERFVEMRKQTIAELNKEEADK